MDAATIINRAAGRASAKRLTRRAVLAGLLANAAAARAQVLTAGGKAVLAGGGVIIPGGGGSVTGVIPTAAATLSAGSTVSVTLPQIWNINQGPSSTIFEYVSRAPWDPVHRKFRFIGLSHSGTIVPTYCDYSIDTDVAYQESFTDGETGPRHGGDGYDLDPVTGTFLYWHYNGSTNFQLRTNAAVWSSNFSNPLAGSQQWANVVWHPTLAQFVNATIWGTWGIPISSPTSFTPYRTTGTGTDMGGGTQTQGMACLNLKDGKAYFGGGSYICNIDGTGTMRTSVDATSPLALPSAAFVYPGFQQSAGVNASLFSASRPANKMIQLVQDTFAGTIVAQAYDEVANSWGSIALPTTLQTFLNGAEDAQWIAASIPDAGGSGKGVMAFLRQISTGGGTMDSTSVLWAY